MRLNDRCRQIVYIPEQLRRTGRGPTGFERHYEKRQCRRKPGPSGWCWQHDPNDEAATTSPPR